MPESNQIQCFIECNKNNFVDYIRKYNNFLDDFFNTSFDNIENMKWKFNEIGFNYLLAKSSYLKFEYSGFTFHFCPNAMIYTENDVPTLALEILIYTEDIAYYTDKGQVYRTVSYNFIKDCLKSFESYFADYIIFITDETLDGKAYKGIVNNDKEMLWHFDIASIPNKSAKIYLDSEPQPKTIKKVTSEDRIIYWNSETLIDFY